MSWIRPTVGTREVAVILCTGLLAACFGVVATAQTSGQDPVGIPRELARERVARVSDVRYHLSYTLLPKATTTEAREELTFRLKTQETKAADANGEKPLLLDFREGRVTSLVVNGNRVDANIENGHIELRGSLLKPGENAVAISFSAPIATAGKAITRFEDKDDGSEYVYTLFVPMDASMAFPCFDQPDIKARFRLELSAPQDWTVIANEKSVGGSVENAGAASVRHHVFAETRPISTYLFAFAAGPFRKVHDVAGMPGLYVRKSKLQKAEGEAAQVQQIAADGIKYLSNYFDQPFPFPKYDMVLIPGFAYGGMEHAGATFLREESVLFRQAPTHSDRLNRDILILHELTHQWFGDLVTMRWFDDLWLKEGFAQYMAYHALDSLKPNEHVWKRFYQAIKPAAYAIDATQGTTPIYQNIPNLKDAKSAYGAIVYSKAPGVMKQLAYVLGEDKFRDGLRLYLKDHAYGNAEWADLVGSFEKVSGQPLEKWADAYIKRRGMPQVDVEKLYCDHPDHVQSLVLKQHDVLGEGGVWPITTQLLLGYWNRPPVRVKVQLNSETSDVANHVGGNTCPDFVFANDQDYAYGRFLLDERSRREVMAKLGTIDDVFERTLLWGSLWDSVREAEMDPREYIDLALRLLPREKDEALAQNIIGHTVGALHWYVSAETRAQIAPKAEALAREEMLHAPTQDMRIVWFRAVRGVAQTESGRETLKELLSGKLTAPGVELRPLDRWSMVTALVALGDKDAETILAAEEKRDPSGDGRKYAFVAKAARPEAKSKQEYFDGYLHDAARPEDWVEQSLGAFNYWNQSGLTYPYLRSALDALPQVKRERKIFFVLAWLNAFIGGQGSAEAQSEVKDFLQSPALDHDLKLKILEVSDDLDRTVKIRAKWGFTTETRSHGEKRAKTKP
jgi:aminopeptidase N